MNEKNQEETCTLKNEEIHGSGNSVNNKIVLQVKKITLPKDSSLNYSIQL